MELSLQSKGLTTLDFSDILAGPTPRNDDDGGSNASPQEDELAAARDALHLGVACISASDNLISHIGPLHYFEALTEVNLSQNRLATIRGEVWPQSLRKLDLSFNNLSHAAFLLQMQCPFLEVVNLAGNELRALGWGPYCAERLIELEEQGKWKKKSTQQQQQQQKQQKTTTTTSIVALITEAMYQSSGSENSEGSDNISDDNHPLFTLPPAVTNLKVLQLSDNEGLTMLDGVFLARSLVELYCDRCAVTSAADVIGVEGNDNLEQLLISMKSNEALAVSNAVLHKKRLLFPALDIIDVSRSPLCEFELAVLENVLVRQAPVLDVGRHLFTEECEETWQAMQRELERMDEHGDEEQKHEQQQGEAAEQPQQQQPQQQNESAASLSSLMNASASTQQQHQQQQSLQQQDDEEEREDNEEGDEDEDVFIPETPPQVAVVAPRPAQKQVEDQKQQSQSPQQTLAEVRAKIDTNDDSIVHEDWVAPAPARVVIADDDDKEVKTATTASVSSPTNNNTLVPRLRLQRGDELPPIMMMPTPRSMNNTNTNTSRSDIGGESALPSSRISVPAAGAAQRFSDPVPQQQRQQQQNDEVSEVMTTNSESEFQPSDSPARRAFEMEQAQQQQQRQQLNAAPSPPPPAASRHLFASPPSMIHHHQQQQQQQTGFSATRTTSTSTAATPSATELQLREQVMHFRARRIALEEEKKQLTRILTQSRKESAETARCIIDLKKAKQDLAEESTALKQQLVKTKREVQYAIKAKESRDELSQLAALVEGQNGSNISNGKTNVTATSTMNTNNNNTTAATLTTSASALIQQQAQRNRRRVVDAGVKVVRESADKKLKTAAAVSALAFKQREQERSKISAEQVIGAIDPKAPGSSPVFRSAQGRKQFEVLTAPSPLREAIKRAQLEQQQQQQQQQPPTRAGSTSTSASNGNSKQRVLSLHLPNRQQASATTAVLTTTAIKSPPICDGSLSSLSQDSVCNNNSEAVPSTAATGSVFVFQP